MSTSVTTLTQRCIPCKGTGFYPYPLVQRAGEPVACLRCGGTGSNREPALNRARALLRRVFIGFTACAILCQAVPAHAAQLDVCELYRDALVAERGDSEDVAGEDGEVLDSVADCKDGSHIQIGNGDTMWAAWPGFTLDHVAEVKDMAFIECPWGYDAESNPECQ